MDIANCFFAIPLTPESQLRLAFTFKNKHLTFRRAPQGSHKTPVIAHIHVTKMWDQLPESDKPGVTSYVDGILVTRTSEGECNHRTTRVTSLVEKTGFKLSWDKAQLVQGEVGYLGTTLGQEG